MWKLLSFFEKASIVLFVCVCVMLGFMQPTYNHWRDTISFLVLGRWGWIQSLNFINLSLGLVAMSWRFHLLNRPKFSRLARLFFGFALTFSLLVLFPANAHDANQLHFTGFSTIQSAGHFGLTALCLGGFFPLIGREFSVHLKKEENWQVVAHFFQRISIICLAVVPIWLVMRMNGWFYGQKGLFEKIGVILLLWLIWKVSVALDSTSVRSEIAHPLREQELRP